MKHRPLALGIPRGCVAWLAAATAFFTSATAIARTRAPRPQLRLAETARESPSGGVRTRSRLFARIPLSGSDGLSVRGDSQVHLRMGAWDLDVSPGRDPRYAPGRRRGRISLLDEAGSETGDARVRWDEDTLTIRMTSRDSGAFTGDFGSEDFRYGHEGFFTDLRTAEVTVDRRTTSLAVAIYGHVDWVPEWGPGSAPRSSFRARGFEAPVDPGAPFLDIVEPAPDRAFRGRMQGVVLVSGEEPTLSLRVDGGPASSFPADPPLSLEVEGTTFRLFPFDTVLDAAGGPHLATAMARAGPGTAVERFADFEMPEPVALGDLDAGSHALEIRGGGVVWAWDAYNWDGELGNGTRKSYLCPVPVTGLSGITSVCAGYDLSLAIGADGSVWEWGLIGEEFGPDGRWLGDIDSTVPVRVPDLGGVTALAAGCGFTLALKADGTVWGWGRNSGRQLLDGTEIYRHRPVRLQGLDRVVAIAPWTALRRDGTVWQWGLLSRVHGGDGVRPVEVPGLPPIRAVDGEIFYVALAEDGTVWQWGGWLEDWKLPPRQVPGLDSVKAVQTDGRGRGIALREDGTVWTWVGADVAHGTGPPDQVPGLAGVERIAAGEAYYLAVTGTGAVWVCGSDFFHSQTLAYEAPRPVLVPRYFTGAVMPPWPVPVWKAPPRHSGRRPTR